MLVIVHDGGEAYTYKHARRLTRVSSGAVLVEHNNNDETMEVHHEKGVVELVVS